MWKLITVPALVVLSAGAAVAQETQPPTREQAIEQAQAEKDKALHPVVPTKAEYWLDKAEEILSNGMKWHPFFENAYSGGGFTLGAGYAFYLGPYSFLDVRGSYTITGYKRFEAEFSRAPALQPARQALGAWRVARCDPGGLLWHRGRLRPTTPPPTTAFTQAIRLGAPDGAPTRRCADAPGRRRCPQWTQKHGEGTDSFGGRGLHAGDPAGTRRQVTYLHAQGTVGLTGWRPRPTTRGAAPSGRHGDTTTTNSDKNSASSRSTTRPSSTSRSCGRPG